jgi:hypothetical protein
MRAALPAPTPQFANPSVAQFRGLEWTLRARRTPVNERACSTTHDRVRRNDGERTHSLGRLRQTLGSGRKSSTVRHWIGCERHEASSYTNHCRHHRQPRRPWAPPTESTSTSFTPSTRTPGVECTTPQKKQRYFIQIDRFSGRLSSFFDKGVDTRPGMVFNNPRRRDTRSRGPRWASLSRSVRQFSSGNTREGASRL